MSYRTKNTENNTMIYLTENDEAETKQEDFAMSFNTSIILFSLYPQLSDDEDNTMPIEHGMVLLDMASDMTDVNKQIAIAGIVLTTAYMLNIAELGRAAHGFISNDKIVDEFYEDADFSRNDIDCYFETIDKFLAIIGIDSSAKKQAMDEIFDIFLKTELS